MDRTRPSLLNLSSCLIGGLTSVVTSAGSSKELVAGIERGLQEEHDEQLRILNAEGVQAPDLRKTIIAMRDEGYDLAQENGLQGESTPLSDAARYATVASMRLARSL